VREGADAGIYLVASYGEEQKYEEKREPDSHRVLRLQSAPFRSDADDCRFAIAKDIQLLWFMLRNPLTTV